MDDRLELMPVRRRLLISAWVEIFTHVGGCAVTLPFYRRRSVTFIVGLWVGLALVVGLASWLGRRTALDG